jgi:hypothetical protein
MSLATLLLGLALGFIAGRKRGRSEGRKAGYVHGRIDAANEHIAYLNQLGSRLKPMPRAEIN